MPAPSPISLNNVASEAGVSAMTVSRVLRNSPCVSPQTRQRVLDTVRRLGYQPDPLIAQLMERVRQQRAHGERETLALVADHPPAPSGLHNYVKLEDIRDRATGHGYRIEPFRIGRGGVSAKRLQGILRARGIRGVLLSAGVPGGSLGQLDLRELAAVTFGFGLSQPSLHRASSNITEGMLDIFSRLESRGYRRIGVAVTPWVDQRAGHTYSGALLHHQQSLPPSRRLPMLMLPQENLTGAFSLFEKWLNKHRPDVLISMHEPVLGWLERLGRRVPEDIGLLIHDWLPAMSGLAGMNHRRHEVAAAAVDLLAAQLQHHEYGVPAVPRQILIPPGFVEGGSLRGA